MKLNFQRPKILPRRVVSRCMVVPITLMFSGSALAEEIPDGNTNYFVVTENDSTQVLFPISDKPEITLNETFININSIHRSYSAGIEHIIDFSFIGESLNAVTSIFDRPDRIEYSGNSIIIKGLSIGDTVSLFDLKGVAVSTYVSKDGNLAIDINQFPTGVYILSTKNANYKIKK